MRTKCSFCRLIEQLKAANRKSFKCPIWRVGSQSYFRISVQNCLFLRLHRKRGITLEFKYLKLLNIQPNLTLLQRRPFLTLQTKMMTVTVWSFSYWSCRDLPSNSGMVISRCCSEGVQPDSRTWRCFDLKPQLVQISIPKFRFQTYKFYKVLKPKTTSMEQEHVTILQFDMLPANQFKTGGLWKARIFEWIISSE